MLIDTHAHLNDKRYDENREELISSLFDNKVEAVFTVSYNKESIIDNCCGSVLALFVCAGRVRRRQG